MVIHHGNSGIPVGLHVTDVSNSSEGVIGLGNGNTTINPHDDWGACTNGNASRINPFSFGNGSYNNLNQNGGVGSYTRPCGYSSDLNGTNTNFSPYVRRYEFGFGSQTSIMNMSNGSAEGRGGGNWSDEEIEEDSEDED